MNNIVAEVEQVCRSLSEAHPGLSITSEVIEGRVVDGFTVEVDGYFGAPRIEVRAKTADAAVDLFLAELERVRSERQSYSWPPRVDDGPAGTPA